MYPSYASDTNCVGDGCVGLRIIAAMSEPIEKPVQPPKWAPRAKRRMADLGITQDDLKGTLKVKTRGAVGHYFSTENSCNGAVTSGSERSYWTTVSVRPGHSPCSLFRAATARRYEM